MGLIRIANLLPEYDTPSYNLADFVFTRAQSALGSRRENDSHVPERNSEDEAPLGGLSFGSWGNPHQVGRRRRRGQVLGYRRSWRPLVAICNTSTELPR